MKTNQVIRSIAWDRLWKGRWFWRLLGGGLLLKVCGQAIVSVISGVLSTLGVDDWQRYLTVMQQNRVTLTTPIPKLTSEYVVQTTSATCLELFFALIMAGIGAYGCAVILRKCMDDDGHRWLGCAFGGFKDPFGMLWLHVRLWLVYLGWALLVALPAGVLCGACFPIAKRLCGPQPIVGMAFAIVVVGVLVVALLCRPFYTYRFLWLVKAEQPHLGAGDCMRICRELMKGNRMRSFHLDCAYWRPITLLLVLACLMTAFVVLSFVFKGNAAVVMLASFGLLAGMAVLFPACMVVSIYMSVGQAFLYRELKECATSC